MQHWIDEASTRFGLDPAAGLQLASAPALLRRPFDPALPMLIVPAANGASARAAGSSPAALPRHDGDFEPPALAGRQAHAADPVALLRALYPADHPLHGLDGRPDTTVGEVDPAALDAGGYLLPALPWQANVASPHALPWLVARLRAPDGCPWDREQDHLSLRPFLLEETYEVYDALERGPTPQLAEELGDLLLQIVLHAHYGAETGVFDLTDVTRSTMTKIIRRHPHVFGDVVAESAADVVRNWEQIKAGERAARAATAADSGAGLETGDRDMPQAFAGLSRSLPALAYAQEMQERAAALGYDWPSVEGVVAKIAEEAAEVASATELESQREELGDLLLVVVNLCRKLGVDAEAALRSASSKFAARFAHVERLAAERSVELRALSLDELDELWREAKTSRATTVGSTR